MNEGMRPSTLAAVFLLLAASAAAEEFYVPLSSRTELQLTNPSSTRVTLAIERLGGDGARELALEPGQTVSWNEETERVGMLRIAADAAINITAVSHCDPCASRLSVPVLDSHDVLAEGAIPLRAQRRDPAWRSEVLVVNPEDGVALLTVTIHRRDGVVDQSLVRIPGRRMRHVQLDEPGDRVTFHSPSPLLLFGYDSNEHTGARVFTPLTTAIGGKRRSVRSPSSPEPPPPPPPPPDPQTIVLTPSKDNTLYEGNGTVSNGAGVHLFAGATAAGALRRALLAFDVASQIPPGSTITKASLRLEVDQTRAGPVPMTLHRVSADWGQGTSNAGASGDGDGTNARTGDATWLHRFFQNQLWATEGGDFDATADASAVVAGFGDWQTSEAMVARVQGWLDQPETNFGWLIRGGETQSTTAKRFVSRESGQAALRPALTIEFIPSTP
jgi:hypothetical protein